MATKKAKLERIHKLIDGLSEKQCDELHDIIMIEREVFVKKLETLRKKCIKLFQEADEC